MRKTVLAALPLLALPLAAAAQDAGGVRGPSMGDWEVTLSGNGSSDNDSDNHTIGASDSVGKYVSPNILLGVRQSINYTDIEQSEDQVNAATRGFADYVFDAGNFRPYVGVSVGGIYGDGVNETFAAGPQGGIKYYADQHTFVFVQTEYLFTFEEANDAREAADDGQFYHTIGIGFNF